MNKKKNLISINNLVTQSNKLIESRYNLNVTEQRLILAMIAMINPEDEDFREYNIEISNLSKVLGLKNKNIYEDIKKVTESVLTKVLKIRNEEGLLQLNWISSAQYNDNLGTVTIKFDPSLKPYLLNIKENYTSTKFGITAKFKSFYTTRIYLLVKQYQKIGRRTVTVDFLREIFPQYEQYKDLKKRILIPAQKEISEISDIKFEIEEKKPGRKVTQVVFSKIRSQTYAQELPLFMSSVQSSEKYFTKLNEKYGVELDIAEKLIEENNLEGDKEEFEKIQKFIDLNIVNKKVKNIAGFAVDSIRKGYYKNRLPTLKKDVEKEVYRDSKDVISEKEIKTNNDDPLFKDILELIKQRMDEKDYEKWMPKLGFVKKENNKILLATQTKFSRDWIVREYLHSFILPAASEVDESVNSVGIISIT